MTNTKIKLIWVGWAWNNTLNRLSADKKISMDYCVICTDGKMIDESPLENKVLMWDGAWVGANPVLWRNLAEQSSNEIKQILSSIDIVLIVAWLGWWTGTGASHVIADIANKMGIVTVWFFTLPFAFEGKARLEQANIWLEQAKEVFDIIFLIRNDRILGIMDKTTPIKEAFCRTDDLIIKILDWIQIHLMQNIEYVSVNKVIEIESLDSTIDETIENTTQQKDEKILSEDELSIPAFLRNQTK